MSWLMIDADKYWTDTTFEFTLSSEAEAKTRVKFTHSGWKTVNNHF